jgi:hypothetical protein
MDAAAAHESIVKPSHSGPTASCKSLRVGCCIPRAELTATSAGGEISSIRCIDGLNPQTFPVHTNWSSICAWAP